MPTIVLVLVSLVGTDTSASRATQTVQTPVPVTVLCSNAVEAILRDLRPLLLRDASLDLQASCDLATNVAASVRAGAIFDIVVLTPGLIDSLAGEGRLAAGSRTPLGRSPIALAQRRGGPRRDVSTVDRLRAVVSTSPSITFAKTGVSGVIFTSLLARWGLEQSMATRLRPQDAGADVSAAVARGAAELGVLPVSEILPVAGIEVAGRFPSELGAFVAMEAAASLQAVDTPGVRALLSFLRSPAATRTLAQAGFEPAP